MQADRRDVGDGGPGEPVTLARLTRSLDTLLARLQQRATRATGSPEHFFMGDQLNAVPTEEEDGAELVGAGPRMATRAVEGFLTRHTLQEEKLPDTFEDGDQAESANGEEEAAPRGGRERTRRE